MEKVVTFGVKGSHWFSTDGAVIHLSCLSYEKTSFLPVCAMSNLSRQDSALNALSPTFVHTELEGPF